MLVDVSVGGGAPLAGTVEGYLRQVGGLVRQGFPHLLGQHREHLRSTLDTLGNRYNTSITPEL